MIQPLCSIIDFDRIFVMDKGRIVETGTPLELMNNDNSMLSDMIGAMDEDSQKALYRKAKETSVRNQHDIKIKLG